MPSIFTLLQHCLEDLELILGKVGLLSGLPGLM